MIALFEAQRAGLFRRTNWAANIVAGLIVGVVALPLAMAFAIASGVKPEQGLYTAIVAGLAVSVFGGSRVQIAGPTGAFIVILAGIVAEHGVVGLQLATLMAGAILLCLGLCRMGSVIKFIPVPVILGFTAGIGIIIWVGQWRDFFGLPAVHGQYFHEKLLALILALPQLDVATTAIGICSLAILLIVPRVRHIKKIPGPLVVLIVMTAFQAVFSFKSVATIGSSFGSIPQGLPSFSLPQFSLSQMSSLIGPAFAIAMLGAIESLLSAVVADRMAGTRHNSNQELIGQGIANMLTPLFGGIAATGALARTATNIRNGGNSPLAGIVHALTLVLVLVVLAPLAVHVPLASLAAILFVVAWNMSEPRQVIALIRRAPRADVAILAITFFITVLADLVVAVNIGVILAMLHFLHRMASSVTVDVQESGALCHQGVLTASLGQQLESAKQSGQAVQIVQVNGPLFFAVVDAFQDHMVKAAYSTKSVVLRLGQVPFVDASGLQALDAVAKLLAKEGIVFSVCEANNRVKTKLHRMGLAPLIGADSLPHALERSLAHLQAHRP